MIYLDNSSTTPIDDEVLESMLPYLKEEFGNPSSRHYTLAVNAEKAIEVAREQVAKLINSKPEEIVFTSGSSEANNFIIKGVADYKKNYENKGNHIITSKVEHKSVLQTCKFLNGDVWDNKIRNESISRFVKLKTSDKKINRGYNVTFLNVNNYAQVKFDDFKNAIIENTILCSLIWGNNEIGSLNDIYTLSSYAKEKNVSFHTDATQVIGKIDVNVKTTPLDFLTFSAHKLHGPKGVGAVYIRKNRALSPNITSLIHGGQQESGYRAGTHAVHNIVGLGKACEIAKRDMDSYIKNIIYIEEQAKKIITQKYPGVIFLGDPQHKIPGIIGMLLPDIINENYIKKLSNEVALSTGSACSISEPSYVIKEIGLENRSSNFIRLSISKNNTIKDIKI